MPPFHDSAIPVLSDLRRRFPHAPFLALGQTVWWDEPMKAVLRRVLDDTGLGGPMVLGVHDTDYFARAHVQRAGRSRFMLLPHNDGETKDLWSAAGEISRLFGSETFPTRHDFLRHGVPFDRLVRAAGVTRTEFLNRTTEAWGWRGLVYTGSRDLIVHRLPLKEVGDGVEEMLRWGFEGTVATIVDQCCRNEARQFAESLLDQVRCYRRDNPDANLTDLYQSFFPRLIHLLLGAEPQDTTVCCTSHLLRFNPQTATLPRFEVLDRFLDPATAKIAREAYNHAVAGAEIYPLDRFGLGALPFDVVVPNHGRGTLRVTLRAIHVETREPLRIPLTQPVHDVGELARVLSAEIGDEVVLVGKAVALISMLAREFIFVFNEEGSAYVRLTRKMNDHFAENGIDLKLHPILRLRYRTWDALEVGQSSLKLPEHLKSAIGVEDIPAPELAARWEDWMIKQQRLLEQVSEIRSPRALLRFLAGRAEGHWEALSADYAARKMALKQAASEAAAIQAEVNALYGRLAEVKLGIVATERAKGDHFRSTTEWTKADEVQRAEFTAGLEALLDERRQILSSISELKSKRLEVERGGDAGKARIRASEIEVQAEMARLQLIRNAILTIRGLPHTQHRPSAWWIPMIDRTGHWFRRIVETTEFYPEPLVTESPVAS